MKKSRQLNPTNIDGLPAHLVDKILIRLPLQDAVRTSMLAKKWRYTCTELSELVFDDNFCEKSIRKSQRKLLRAINQVLLIHRGPLNKFSLSLSNLESCSEIDQFVLVVLRKGVKQLILDIKRGDGPYRLPSPIFAHAQQLELLHFSCCVFKLPLGFKGFGKLTKLDLCNVVDTSDYEVSSLISNSPLLEYFSLSTCSFTTYNRLDIDNPNLKFLSLDCLCESICFINTPKLAKVDVMSSDADNDELTGNGAASGKFTLCGKLPAVKVLVLDNFYFKNTTANKTPRSIVDDLCHLKTLELWNLCFGTLDEVFSALCFMRNCPKLEQLSISLEYIESSEPVLELSEVEGFSDANLDYLKEVELKNVTGTTSELQFIKLILAKSPVLDNFLMIPGPRFVGEKDFSFFKELSTYQRASPLVKLTYG